MRFLKQYRHFESLTPKSEGLDLLGEISDIFNNLEDEYKMSVDYYLTILHQEYEDNNGQKLLSNVTFDLSSELESDGQLWWNGDVPRCIFTIRGKIKQISPDKILEISKEIESGVARCQNYLGVNLVHEQKGNNFGGNYLIHGIETGRGVVGDKYRLVGTNPPFSWLSRDGQYVNSIESDMISRKIKGESPDIEFRIDLMSY